MSPMTKAQTALNRLNAVANALARDSSATITSGAVSQILGDVAECFGELIAEVNALIDRK